MGKRGPRPTPTAELAARGSWLAKTKRRQNEVTIPVLLDVPSAPGWISEPAAEEFNRLAPMLHATGLLSLADVDTLALLAEKRVQFADLRDLCKSESPTIYNADGVGRKNPTYTFRDEASRDLLKLYQELGMSPSARVGLVTTPKEKPTPTSLLGVEGDFAT